MSVWNKKWLIIVDGFISQAAAAANYPNLDASIRQIYDDNTRPAAPFPNIGNVTIDDTKLGPVVSPSSRHHVIPWQVIIRIWDKVFFPQQTYGTYATFCTNALTVFTNKLNATRGGYAYTGLFTVNPGDLTTMIAFMQQSYGSLGTLAAPGAATIAAFSDYHSRTDLQAALAWLPGNLFIGPNSANRSDDPGQGLDSRAGKAANMDMRLAENLYRLLSSNSNIMTFNAAALQLVPKTPSMNREMYYRTEFCNFVEGLVKQSDLHPFRSALWEVKQTAAGIRWSLKQP